VPAATADSIKWFPRVKIEKYSADQTAWAERKLTEELSWGRRLLVARFGVRTPVLHGDWLREVFSTPEDGYAFAEGNQLVSAGLTNLISVLTNTTGTAVNKLVTQAGGTSGAAVCGVGSDATVNSGSPPTYTHLAPTSGESGSTTYYQSMDTSYPSLTTPQTINGQSTFASGVANFAWNEWCWATGAGTITAGNTLSSVYGTASSVAMLNRKQVALGTKASGASWVFSTTVTFS
jgi:hypothetical protein